MSTSRTMERTLTMLLPTATGIPRELIETAGSLVAQSRQRVSNLGPTEEPAREMDRLKTKLDLPAVPDKPMAPVPPRVYKILFKQFSDALVATQKTPVKRRPAATTAATAGSTSTSMGTSTASSSRLPSVRGKLQFPAPKADSAVERKIDGYRPLISELCASVPDAIPHVTAGTRYIFSAARYKNLTERPEVLLCAVYVVAARELVLRREEGGEDAARQREWYDGRVAEVAAFLDRRGVKDTGEGAGWRDWFDEAVAEVAGEDMRATRWYTEMVGQTGVGGGDEEEEAGLEEEEEEEAPARGKGRRGQVQVMESGIGSMMQDRVDFLSDRRRRAFAEWKADALRRIAQLEA
ncbi:hypothetical protein Dda_1020 [Drechslerella dactyloides]|uniref:ORC6 first cyclin-like domain-containing protein n=1 Tax=Drechslerella dactyloides TaxID=74499 RepID=A0AAD6J8G4_DREDA|nr:hypothetical protein Dda_1020 [Drechslerella dactyloides]